VITICGMSAISLVSSVGWAPLGAVTATASLVALVLLWASPLRRWIEGLLLASRIAGHFFQFGKEVITSVEKAWHRFQARTNQSVGLFKRATKTNQ
jgi:hypothetical protein